MNVTYHLDLTQPQTHRVAVTLQLSEIAQDCRILTFFLPAWTPGSYLIREYSRHLQQLRVQETATGAAITVKQINKAHWQVCLPATANTLTVQYEVYCHEFNVRCSHVDSHHAFLHGPTLFLGVLEHPLTHPMLELTLPTGWYQVSTGLQKIQHGPHWQFQAADYDELLDCPLEIGTHSVHEFEVAGKTHELACYGQTWLPVAELMTDIKRLVETEIALMQAVPYERYVFIIQFAPNSYNGLEHRNSTAIHFDARTFSDRQSYLRWLGLIAHEFFHLWNIKRIRPRELGPFDYSQENYTRMLWLAEGLTSFMDDLFILRAGLCTLEEYLTIQKDYFARYYQNYGRHVQSLEQSSFDAWIKLYRPEENTANITVSYYLKGGLVFSLLNCLLLPYQRTIDDVVLGLWQLWCERPEQGVTTEEVLTLIERLSTPTIRQQFQQLLTSTEEIDFAAYYQNIGLKFVWEEAATLELGIQWELRDHRLIAKSVQRDSLASQYGIYAGDELLAINNTRIYPEEQTKFMQWLLPQQRYTLVVARLGQLVELTLDTGSLPQQLQQLESTDSALTMRVLMGTSST